MSQFATSPGSHAALGVTLTEGGANVAVLSRHASVIEFCLFDDEGRENRIALPARTGDVHHGEIAGTASALPLIRSGSARGQKAIAR